MYKDLTVGLGNAELFLLQKGKGLFGFVLKLWYSLAQILCLMVTGIVRTSLLKRALEDAQVKGLSFAIYLSHSSRWMLLVVISKVHETFSCHDLWFIFWFWDNVIIYRQIQEISTLGMRIFFFFSKGKDCYSDFVKVCFIQIFATRGKNDAPNSGIRAELGLFCLSILLVMLLKVVVLY